LLHIHFVAEAANGFRIIAARKFSCALHLAPENMVGNPTVSKPLPKQKVATMSHPNVLVAITDHVMTIEISRRDKKNSLTTEMYHALSKALLHAREHTDVRAVLIHGQPDLFSAGNDLADFLARKNNEQSAAIPFLHLLASFEKPLVAAVGGNAVGIGTTLLLHCDLVFAATDAKFQLPFVNLALCPEGASSQLLPLTAGHRLAAELLMLGEVFDAETAQRAGIVGRIVVADELLDAALVAARKLAAKPVQALAVTKTLMKRTPDLSMIDRIDEEAIHFGELLGAPAAKEIFAAFLEKRVPDPTKLNA
jgi:enoyl-CoA hydratase/carnithine racemase